MADAVSGASSVAESQASNPEPQLGPVLGKATISLGIETDGTNITTDGSAKAITDKTAMLVVGGVLAKPIMVGSLLSAAGHIVGAVAEEGSNVSDGLLNAAKTFKDVDTVETALTAAPKAGAMVISIIDAANAKPEVKTVKVINATRDTLKFASAGVKLARLIGQKFTKMADGIVKILSWIGHGLKIIANVFDAVSAGKSLAANRYTIPEEKTADILRIIQVIITIAFFSFLIISSIFSFGLATVIATGVLGGMFGIGLLVNGVFKHVVEVKKSKEGVKALEALLQSKTDAVATAEHNVQEAEKAAEKAKKDLAEAQEKAVSQEDIDKAKAAAAEAIEANKKAEAAMEDLRKSIAETTEKVAEEKAALKKEIEAEFKARLEAANNEIKALKAAAANAATDSEDEASEVQQEVETNTAPAPAPQNVVTSEPEVNQTPAPAPAPVQEDNSGAAGPTTDSEQ